MLAWQGRLFLINPATDSPACTVSCFTLQHNKQHSEPASGSGSLKESEDLRISMMGGGAGGNLGLMEDVEAERQRVDKLSSYSDTPIVIKDIKKTYPGVDGGKPKVGVASRWMDTDNLSSCRCWCLARSPLHVHKACASNNCFVLKRAQRTSCLLSHALLQS
jgi:hypothetical protein